MPNLYIRYFDREVVVSSIDDAMDFLDSIKEIKIETNVADRIMAFMDSKDTFPFRLKVSYSNYILFLKTDAVDLREFREMEMMRKERMDNNRSMSMADRKRNILDGLRAINPGWYQGSLLFKRVVLIPGTNKFEYQDTRFTARCKANSAMDCYERIIAHLKGRHEIDPRSQFPSAKSCNFDYKYLCSF